MSSAIELPSDTQSDVYHQIFKQLQELAKLQLAKQAYNTSARITIDNKLCQLDEEFQQIKTKLTWLYLSATFLLGKGTMIFDEFKNFENFENFEKLGVKLKDFINQIPANYQTDYVKLITEIDDLNSRATEISAEKSKLIGEYENELTHN